MLLINSDQAAKKNVSRLLGSREDTRAQRTGEEKTRRILGDKGTKNQGMRRRIRPNRGGNGRTSSSETPRATGRGLRQLAPLPKVKLGYVQLTGIYKVNKLVSREKPSLK